MPNCPSVMRLFLFFCDSPTLSNVIVSEGLRFMLEASLSHEFFDCQQDRFQLSDLLTTNFCPLNRSSPRIGPSIPLSISNSFCVIPSICLYIYEYIH
jgi:hypothetical protein